MSDIYITKNGSYLHKDQECLVAKFKTETIAKVPFKDIDSIHLFGNVQFSTQFLQEMLKRNITFSFYSHRGNFLGQITSPFPKNMNLRVKQVNLNKNDSFRLDISKQILFAKFSFGIQFLEESMTNHPELVFKDKIFQLKKWKYKLLEAADINSLFGLEGSFASMYYTCYTQLFPEKDFFKGRSKHPPKDEGNAALSFISVLISNRVGSLLEGKGLDPYFGFLHGNQYGRKSLCYDIVEPLRPLFCERLAVKLFSLNILKKEDFETVNNSKAVYLKQASQKKFFGFYGDELKAERNYKMITGNLDEVIFLLTDWLKACINNEKVDRLRIDISK